MLYFLIKHKKHKKNLQDDMIEMRIMGCKTKNSLTVRNSIHMYIHNA